MCEIATPIQNIGFDNFGNEILVKRDDLLPLSFGGNKLRIGNEFISDLESKNCDCLIGYGSIKSNLSRVLANLCSEHNIECHIISQVDNEMQKSNNCCLSLISNAKIHYCNKKEVANTVERTLQECIQQGKKPYYIYGNCYGYGNENVPVRAYYKAYIEIEKQRLEISKEFDYIFVATGTGMTQSGLLCGSYEYSKRPIIVGISIAREKKRCIREIERYVSSWRQNYPKGSIIVDDSVLLGGYGNYNKEMQEWLMQLYNEKGMLLDHTYVGKAYYGMRKYIQRNNIHDSCVLFMHTGGTPLLFDTDSWIFDLGEEYDQNFVSW